MNLIGTPVTDTIERAAPPRASPSSLDSTRPVTPIRSWNSFAAFTASCPVIASTTNSVSTGDTASLTSSSSDIKSSSICVRPAVSTIAHVAPTSAARRTPSRATRGVGLDVPSSYTSTSIRLPKV